MVVFLLAMQTARVRIPLLAPYAELAQLGEHLPYKQGVGGSSPSFRTKASAYWLDASRTCVVGMFEWRGETP